MVKMITFMLSTFHHTHENPTLFPLLIPEAPDTSAPSGGDTRAEPHSRQNSVCWWRRDTVFHSSFRSLRFGSGSILQSPGASLGSSQLEEHRSHPKSPPCLPVCPPALAWTPPGPLPAPAVAHTEDELRRKKPLLLTLCSVSLPALGAHFSFS